MSPVRIVISLIGLYLIIEGFGSFIIFADQNPIFDAGRILRVVFGIFLIWVSFVSNVEK